MKPETSLSDEQRAELVAYLDGELDGDASVAVEKLLASNPAARREAELLSRTFELLDELPHVAPSQEFTARTLAAIQVSESGRTRKLSARNWSRPTRRVLITAGTVCVLAAAALAGYLSTNRWIPDRSETLIRDLPIIENVDKYAEVEDIAFLQALERSEMFNDSDKLPEF